MRKRAVIGMGTLAAGVMVALAGCAAADAEPLPDPKVIEVTTRFGEVVTCVQGGGGIDCNWEHTRHP